MKSRAALAAALAGALAVVLTGCGPAVASANYKGVPDGAVYGQNSGEMLDGVQVGWLDDGALIALTTYGSSSCPVPPDAVNVHASGGLIITLGSATGWLCTADLRATTYEIPTPAAVDLSTQVAVEVGGLTLDLPAIRGESS